MENKLWCPELVRQPQNGMRTSGHIANVKACCSNPSLSQTSLYIDRLSTSTLEPSYNRRNRITDCRRRSSVEHSVTACSCRKIIIKELILDTCVSYRADTSRIVHQSHDTATCLAILIHKSGKVGIKKGRSRKQLSCGCARVHTPQISARSMDSLAN